MAKKIRLAILFLLLIFIFTGCTDIDTNSYENTLEKGGANYEKLNNSENIITLLEFEIESNDFHEDLEYVSNLTYKAQGYIDSYETKPAIGNKDLLQAKVTLKVPKENARQLISKIRDSFEVTGENSHTINIYEKINELENEIEDLILKENRLNELYNKIENIDEILKVEEEISKVVKIKNEKSREIDNILEKLEHSKIRLTINEVKKAKIAPEFSIIFQMLVILLLGVGFIYGVAKPMKKKEVEKSKKKDE